MSTELERVREKLYERASITLTEVFERLVREDERAKMYANPLGRALEDAKEAIRRRER